MSEDNKEYKEFLITNILNLQNDDAFTREELEQKSISSLEIIYDRM